MLPEPRRNGRRAMDTALDVAGPVLDALEAGLGLSPVPGLELIPKALSAVVKKVKVARANEEQREAFLDTVRLLSSTLGATAAKARHSEIQRADAGNINVDDGRRAMEDVAHSPEFIRAIQNLVRTFDELQKLADTLESKGGVSGFLKGVVHGSRNDKTLKDMQRRLATAIDAFQLDGHRAIDRGIQGIQRLQKDSDEQRIITQLAWADAGYRAVDYLKSGFVDGTRKELVKKLRSWLKGRFPEYDPKRFCLLTAGAGMGKSAVAHRFCRYIFDKEFAFSDPVYLGASFFFVRGGGDKASALLLAPTIARQLASCHPALCTYIARAAKQYVLLGGRQQVGYAFDSLLAALPAALPASMGRNARVAIVIDGLDECAEQDLVCEALARLFALVRRLPWLYVFAAARPEPRIMHAFASGEASGVAYHEDLGEPVESYGDVELYLRATVPKIRSYATFVRKHPAQLSKLVSRANGLFVYAQTLVRFLETYCDYPEEGFRLALSRKGDGLSAVDALYLQILESAFPPEQMRKSPHIHAHLLAFLYLLLLKPDISLLASAVIGSSLCRTTVIQRRLSGSITSPADDLSEETIINMVSRLRAVVTFKTRVDPLHASFGEFLLNPARCTNPLYQIIEGEGHAGMISAFITLWTPENMLHLYHTFDIPRNGVFTLCNHLSEHMQGATWTPELQADLTALVRGSRMLVILRMDRDVSHSSEDGPGPLLEELSYADLRDLCLRMQNNYSGSRYESLNSGTGVPLIPWASIPSEYLKFCTYCSLCQDYLENPRLVNMARAPVFSAEDIRQTLSRYAKFQENPIGLEDWAVAILDLIDSWNSREPFDIEGYRAALQAFKADIIRWDPEEKSWWHRSFRTYYSNTIIRSIRDAQVEGHYGL